MYQLLNEGKNTIWNNSILYWKDIITKEDSYKLDKVKCAFDAINGESIQNYIDNEKSNLKSDLWLYYILNRDYDYLFANDITINNGIYQKGSINFYSYVLKRDLLAKGYTFTTDYIEKYDLSGGSIKPREDDGYTRKRNLTFTIKFILSIDNLSSSVMICYKDNYFYNYNFSCLKNNEDYFEEEIDITTILTELDNMEKDYSYVANLIEGLSETEKYDLIFNGNCSLLSNKIKNYKILNFLYTVV